MKKQYDKGWCDPDDEDDYYEEEDNDGEQDEYIDDEYDY